MNSQVLTERFEMRLGQSDLDVLDAWRARQADVPSRSEAVRRLMQQGLAAKDKPEKRDIRLGDGERLILVMLCQLFKHLKLKGGEIDANFVMDVIAGGHYWGLDWKYSGLYHGHEDSRAVVTEVVNILDMWYFLEHGYAALSKKDKDRVAEEAGPFGSNVRFPGFDGNHEGEHMRVTDFLIKKLGRFSEFEGRGLNAHMPTLEGYRRMLPVFEPIRKTLTGRDLNKTEIIEILNARLHPSRRKA